MGSRPSQFVLTQAGPIRLYSTNELLSMPEPEWLVDNITPVGGLLAIYGQPECGKSFVALDFALCVATGRPWQSRAVKRGFVVYIAAEGGTGVGKRVRAWLQHNNVRPEEANIAWLVEPLPINATSEELATLVNRIFDEVEERPVLIVIDTLARCFDGDENQQEDMGRFVAGIDMLRHEFRCTVAVVHHTRLGGDRERGNTAFRGAADTMIAVSKDGVDIHLDCTKQKDFEHFESIDLELLKVEGTNSCVVVGGQAAEKLQNDTLTALAALHNTFIEVETGKTSLSPGLSWDDWRTATGLDHGRFQKMFYHLKREGKVEKVKGLWRAKVERG